MDFYEIVFPHKIIEPWMEKHIEFDRFMLIGKFSKCPTCDFTKFDMILSGYAKSYPLHQHRIEVLLQVASSGKAV